MDLPFVGVQGHQKPLENPKTLMKIDVFVCLVVREPGVPGGAAPSRTPPFSYRPPTADMPDSEAHPAARRSHAHPRSGFDLPFTWISVTQGVVGHAAAVLGLCR